MSQCNRLNYYEIIIMVLLLMFVYFLLSPNYEGFTNKINSKINPQVRTMRRTYESIRDKVTTKLYNMYRRYL